VRGQTPAYVSGCSSARPRGRRSRGSSRAGASTPCRRLSLSDDRERVVVVDLDHGEVGRETVGGGAMPVVFAGLDDEAVAEAEDLIDRQRRWQSLMPKRAA
jgi:hypothetical protein